MKNAKTEEKMEGIAESLKDSVARYHKAAALGLDSAQYALGVCYEYGIGVEIDAAQAEFWYKAAAAQGHTAPPKVRFTMGSRKRRLSRIARTSPLICRYARTKRL